MNRTCANVTLQTETPAINGYVAPGFERVREAFEENFRLRNEVGASFAVYRRGKKLVDLWGGFRDKSRRLPWEENTPALVTSTIRWRRDSHVRSRSGSQATTRGITRSRSDFTRTSCCAVLIPGDAPSVASWKRRWLVRWAAGFISACQTMLIPCATLPRFRSRAFARRYGISDICPVLNGK